jgi:hypothetical protein
MHTYYYVMDFSASCYPKPCRQEGLRSFAPCEEGLDRRDGDSTNNQAKVSTDVADDTEARSLAGGATVADDSRAPLGLTSVVVTEPLLDVVTMVVSPLADEVELTLLMGNEADPEAVNLGGGASGVGDVTADRAAFNDAEFTLPTIKYASYYRSVRSYNDIFIIDLRLNQYVICNEM